MTDSDDPIVIGGQTTYIVNVTNEGDAIAYNTLVTVQIPEMTSFISASGPTSYTLTDGLVTYDPIASINPGDSQMFYVTVEADDSGYVIAEATVTADEYPQIVEVQEGTTIYGSVSSSIANIDLTKIPILTFLGAIGAAAFILNSRKKNNLK